jgi:cysteinyl-tRNA synthetase
MSLYKEISKLLPHLQSVRKIKDYLSIDVSFPKSWKLPKKFVEEDKIMEQQSPNPEERLISFVSEIDEITIDNCLTNIQNIIQYNREREEKERLFDEKVKELKIVFEKQTLKELQDLKFNIKNKKVQLEDNEEEIRTAKLVEK